jgi:BMFP domain-containing protein YqiC
MIDLRLVDELTRKLGDSLPPGVAQLKDDIEGRFRSVLTGAFERMNLVGREEYDAQCAILEETREKLAALESRLDELSPDL